MITGDIKFDLLLLKQIKALRASCYLVGLASPEMAREELPKVMVYSSLDKADAVIGMAYQLFHSVTPEPSGDYAFYIQGFMDFHRDFRIILSPAKLDQKLKEAQSC